MRTIKSYHKATKPRHIVNGRNFYSFVEAMRYIEANEFELDRIEKIVKITIYHIKTPR